MAIFAPSLKEDLKLNKLAITKTAKLSGAKYVKKCSSRGAQDCFYQDLETAEQGMRINEIVFDIDEYIKILYESKGMVEYR
jgi:hypothetical protein